MGWLVIGGDGVALGGLTAGSVGLLILKRRGEVR